MSDAYSRGGDPYTSHAAAGSVHAAALERLVLTSLRTAGPATSFQLADRLQLSLVTVSPRMKPLVRKGLVRDSGGRHKGESGRRRIVWEAL